MEQVEFETLLYGWSDWGIERTVGFQVIAASDGFRASIENDGALWRSAHRLCYYPDTAAGADGKSVGWVSAKNGIYVFRREAAGPDLFGRGGGFRAQILYSHNRPSVRTILSVLRGDVWTDASRLGPGDTHLSKLRVDAADDAPLPLERPAFTDSLLSAVLTSLADRRRVRVHAQWSEVLDALACIADRLPVSDLLSRPVSTLEGPSTINDYWIAGCAGDGCESATTDTAISVTDEPANGDRTLAHTFFDSREHVSAALSASGGTASFDAPSFASLLKILGDVSAPLRRSEKQAIASSPDVLRVVLADPGLRSRVVGSILDDWSNHGDALARSMPKLNSTEQTAATEEIAAYVLLAAARRKHVPDVVSALQAECPSFVPLLADRLLFGCEENPELVKSMPAHTAVAVLSRVSRNREVPQAFIDTALALPVEFRSQLASKADTPTSIRASILEAAAMRGDCRLVRDSLHVGDTDCWTLSFSRLTGHDLASALASVVSCSTADVSLQRTAITALEHLLSIRTDPEGREIILQTLLKQSRTQNQLTASCAVLLLPSLRPDERELAARHVTNALTNLVMVRSNAGQHPLLSEQERKAVRRVRHSHPLLDDWDFAIQASGGYGLDDREKVARASEIQHRLDRSSSDQIRLAMFLCWFEGILVAVDSEQDFLLFMEPAVGLDPLLVWSDTLAACAGRVDHLVSRAVGSRTAAKLVESAVSAVRIAERRGDFGTRWGRPSKASKQVHGWLGAMEAMTSEGTSRRSRPN